MRIHLGTRDHLLGREVMGGIALCQDAWYLATGLPVLTSAAHVAHGRCDAALAQGKGPNHLVAQVWTALRRLGLPCGGRMDHLWKHVHIRRRVSKLQSWVSLQNFHRTDRTQYCACFDHLGILLAGRYLRGSYLLYNLLLWLQVLHSDGPGYRECLVRWSNRAVCASADTI